MHIQTGLRHDLPVPKGHLTRQLKINQKITKDIDGLKNFS